MRAAPPPTRAKRASWSCEAARFLLRRLKKFYMAAFTGKDFYEDTQPWLDEGRYLSDKYWFGKKKWGTPQSRIAGKYQDRKLVRQAHHVALRKQLRAQKRDYRRDQHEYYHQRGENIQTESYKRKAPVFQSRTRNVYSRRASYTARRPTRPLPAIPRRSTSFKSYWYKPHAYWNPNIIRLY